MAIAMGTPVTFWATAEMRPANLRVCSFLIAVIMVAAVNKPVMVTGKEGVPVPETPPPPPPPPPPESGGDQPSSVSTLEVYMHEKGSTPNATAMVVVSPSADAGGPSIGFGTIAIIDNIVREGEDGNSTLLGAALGEAAFGADLSLYIRNTFVLNTTSYVGSISLQGVVDPQAVGELGIAAGTGDFRSAKGYAEFIPVSMADDVNIYKFVFHIVY